VGMSVGGAVEEGFVGGKVSFSDVLLPWCYYLESFSIKLCMPLLGRR
jgi:hypothetical protein